MKNSLNEKKKEKDKDKDKEKEKEQFKIPQLSYNFNMSNIIVKNIIEKIISLTITRALQNKISNQIPSFCFQEIKDSLNLALYIPGLRKFPLSFTPVVALKSNIPILKDFKYIKTGEHFHHPLQGFRQSYLLPYYHLTPPLIL